jgi:hypothetical protein
LDFHLIDIKYLMDISKKCHNPERWTDFAAFFAPLSPQTPPNHNIATMAALATTYGSSPALLLNSPTTTTAAASGDGEGVVSNVLVHPIVLLSVLDHHTRRQEGAGRVIGTLLGRRDGDTVRFLFHRLSLCINFSCLDGHL